MTAIDDPDALRGAVHDLHARLGSIRIAVTAVAGLDLDAETRTSMLNSASDEAVRASAELTCVAALATCLLDTSDVAPCDVAAALHVAADAARLAGFEVTFDAPNDVMMASARVARLRSVLPALVRLVGGTGKAVTASAVMNAARVHVHLRRTGTDRDPERLAAVAGYLVEQLGARHEADADADGLAFSLAATE
jgi:hypothetical protein